MGRDWNEQYSRHDAKNLDEPEVSKPKSAKPKKPLNFLVEQWTGDINNRWKLLKAFDSARKRDDYFEHIKKCFIDNPEVINYRRYRFGHGNAKQFERAYRKRDISQNSAAP